MRAVYPTVAIVTVLLLVLPLFAFQVNWILILFLFFIYWALANMWNVLAGYSGLVSLGQPAFVGLAGYTLGVTSLVGLSPFIGVIAGGLAASGFAFVIAFPTLRLKGLYFSIGTLMVTEAMSLFFVSYKPPGAGSATWGGAGIAIKSAAAVSLTEIYYLSLIVGFCSFLVVRYVLRSKLGLGLMAIRDNERAASSLGVDIFRSKMYSLIISAFFTGLASSVFYIFQGQIEPLSGFGINWLIIMLMATIIGGIGTEEGPIIGAAITVLLQQILAAYGGVNLVIQGVILIAVISLAPRGVVGTWRKVWRGSAARLQPVAPPP